MFFCSVGGKDCSVHNASAVPTILHLLGITESRCGISHAASIANKNYKPETHP